VPHSVFLLIGKNRLKWYAQCTSTITHVNSSIIVSTKKVAQPLKQKANTAIPSCPQ